MLTSSTQLQNKSFHVVERTRTSSKCQKMKNALAKRAKILFFIVKYANLWGFCCHCRRGCLSSLINPLSCPLKALPLQPHPYPKKDSNKPISYTSCRLYRTVLVPSSNKTKQVKVAVIKLKTENLSLAHMELLEREFLCTGEKNGLLSRHTEHGMAVTLNVDHVTDPVTLVSIPDGKYDSYEELVTSFSTLDKLMCDDTPSSRNSPVDVVEMENVIETLQKMNETVVVAYGLAESPTNAIQCLVKGLVAALTQLGYLSSLFDTPEIYSELIQIALEKFQTHYNKNCGVGTTKLPNNGQLCPITWKALKRSLEEGSVSE